MGFFKKREKSHTPTFYEFQIARFEEKLKDAEIGSEDYVKLIHQLETFKECYKESASENKEKKRIFDKELAKDVIAKIIGCVGIAGLLFLMTKFEKVDGSLMSGTNGEVKSGLLKAMLKATFG